MRSRRSTPRRQPGAWWTRTGGWSSRRAARSRAPRPCERLVVARRGGRPILLGDVAQVTDGPEREPAVVLTASKEHPGFEQAVSVDVAKRRGANATVLAEQVQAKLAALAGRPHPGERAGRADPELGRDRARAIGRADPSPAHRHALGGGPGGAGDGLALGAGGGDRRPGDPVAHPAHQPAARSHPEPHHAVRADLLHRHPGGRRHRGGGERPPPPVRCRGGRRASRGRCWPRWTRWATPPSSPPSRSSPPSCPWPSSAGSWGRTCGPSPSAGAWRCCSRWRSPSSSRPGRRCAFCRHDHARAPRTRRRARPGPPGRTGALMRTAAPLGAGARSDSSPLVLALFAGAAALVGVGFVRVKMLPFDNKSEFQVFVDLPAGATAGAGARGGPAAGPHACSRTRTWSRCRCTRSSRRP